MKTSELFKEYIWLIRTLMMFGQMTLEEINEEWVDTEMSGGVEQDVEKAKQYYRVAYREGHPLARRKLKVLNFLE